MELFYTTLSKTAAQPSLSASFITSNPHEVTIFITSVFRSVIIPEIIIRPSGLRNFLNNSLMAIKISATILAVIIS